MRRVRAYVLRHLEEIAADPALRAFGAALAATHVLTVGWLLYYGYAPMLAAGRDAICWPLVPECDRLRLLSRSALVVAFMVYAAASVIVAAGFVKRKWAGPATWGLVLLTIFKIFVLALDFR